MKLHSPAGPHEGVAHRLRQYHRRCSHGHQWCTSPGPETFNRTTSHDSGWRLQPPNIDECVQSTPQRPPAEEHPQGSNGSTQQRPRPILFTHNTPLSTTHTTDQHLDHSPIVREGIIGHLRVCTQHHRLNATQSDAAGHRRPGPHRLKTDPHTLGLQPKQQQGYGPTIGTRTRRTPHSNRAPL